MNVWFWYNPSPTGRNVGDCAVRAVAKALGTDWETAYAMIAENGFVRSSLPPTCPDCYTAEDFALDHPSGTYVLGFGNHVATVRDGRLYDSWDSSHEIPQYYWEKVN